jgi:hypothetical protein
MKKIFFSSLLIFCSILTINGQVNLDSGLVAYYPFTGNANDSSGNGNHGTVIGAKLTTDRNGNFNSAYDFNGITDVINVPHSKSLDITKDITLCAWINVEPKSLPYLGRIVLKNHGVNRWIIYGMFHSASNNISVQLDDITDSNAVYLKSIDNIVKKNRWQFLVSTWDGDSLRLYVNCDLVKTIYTKNDGIFSNLSPVTIGNSDNPEIVTGINGKIDDVRIYNRALNKKEITTLCTFDYITLNEGVVLIKPNPTSGNFTISSSDELLEINIYNSIGQLIISKNVNGITSINLNLEASGVYYIKVKTTFTSETKKLIVGN